jgi:hypothetical protein
MKKKSMKHSKVMPEKMRAGMSPRGSSRPGGGAKMIPKTGQGTDPHTMGRTMGLTQKHMS